MAPSKHILTLMLGATLALSACSTQEAGAAAVVDGTSIRDKDVQTVSLELDTLLQGQQKVTPGTILFDLILAPYVLDEASRTGKEVTDAKAQKAIVELATRSKAKLANPSPPTVEFVRMQLAVQSLTNASRESILTKLAKAKITVNPRYGTFDFRTGALTPTSPDWIKAAASSPSK